MGGFDLALFALAGGAALLWIDILVSFFQDRHPRFLTMTMPHAFTGGLGPYMRHVNIPVEANDPQRRSVALLRSWLTEEQRREYDFTGHFCVHGGVTKKRYHIRDDRNSYNIFREDGFAFCFYPHDGCVDYLPMADRMLGQKIALEQDEENALRIANSAPAPVGWMPAHPDQLTLFQLQQQQQLAALQQAAGLYGNQLGGGTGNLGGYGGQGAVATGGVGYTWVTVNTTNTATGSFYAGTTEPL